MTALGWCVFWLVYLPLMAKLGREIDGWNRQRALDRELRRVGFDRDRLS